MGIQFRARPAVLGAVAMCGVLAFWAISTYSTEEPSPSPLFSRSLVQSTERMSGTVEFSAAEKQKTNLLLPEVALQGSVCVYELICASGNPDTLADSGLFVGTLRRGANCHNQYQDCVPHLETGAGSICLIWQFVRCDTASLRPIPFGSAYAAFLCSCESLPTLDAVATCQASTCRSQTCRSAPSCPGIWIPTMGCPVQTCSTWGPTCSGSTCVPEPTCFSQYPTCRGYSTCQAPTCGPLATCPPASTCTETCNGQATCGSSFTCTSHATCPGAITCGGPPDCEACSCPHQGDLNGDGVRDVRDLTMLVSHLFLGKRAPVQDSTCYHTDRGDLNCDGRHNIADVRILIDEVWHSVPSICDPCTHSAWR